MTDIVVTAIARNARKLEGDDLIYNRIDRPAQQTQSPADQVPGVTIQRGNSVFDTLVRAEAESLDSSPEGHMCSNTKATEREAQSRRDAQAWKDVDELL